MEPRSTAAATKLAAEIKSELVLLGLPEHSTFVGLYEHADAAVVHVGTRSDLQKIPEELLGVRLLKHLMGTPNPRLETKRCSTSTPV